MKQLDTTQRREKPISVLSIILGVLSVIFIFAFGHKNRLTLSTVVKFSILSIVLLTVTMFYILIQHEKIYEKKHFKLIFGILYLGALLCILLLNNKPSITVWMISGLLTAMLFDMYLGFMVTLIQVFFASFAGGYELEFIIYLLILGTLMCLLSDYMKQYSTLLYTVVITLSIQLILIFVINNFILANSLNITAVYSLISTLAVLIVSFLIYTLYRMKNEKSAKKEEHDSSITVNIESDVYPVITDESAVTSVDTEKTSVNNELSLEEILDPNFPLLVQLKEHSEKVYNYSLLISDLAEKAAKAIGANELVAKAGGLYHEIGRISNKEYVEEGIKIAQEYHLPSSVLEIIKQHNIKYDKPKTPEAAIIMIAISIMAAKEYLEKTDKVSGVNGQAATPIAMGKIVENVFQMRLSRGGLDESGLTLKQYNDLKEFFLHM